MLTPIPDICAAFGLGELVSTTEAGGTRNKSFIVETGRGRWVIRRRFPGYCDPDRIAFDHSAAAYLAQRGAPILAPQPDARGVTFIQLAGDIWEVYAFCQGRHLRDGDEGDVVALAGSLAELHEAGRSFGGRYNKLGPRGETDPDHLLASIARVRADSPDADDLLQTYAKTMADASSKLPDELYLSLPHTLVHGDVQPANIMMGDGCVTAFLDIDWCAWRPRIYDLCFALLCCCASHKHPVGDGDVWALTQSPNLDPQLARAFLEVYQSRYVSLTQPEQAALAPQLVLSWCHVRVDNSLKVPAGERRRFLERELQAAAQALQAIRQYVWNHPSEPHH